MQARPGKPSCRQKHRDRATGDVILSLDWVDIAGTLGMTAVTTAKLVQVSVDHRRNNRWTWTIKVCYGQCC